MGLSWFQFKHLHVGKELSVGNDSGGEKEGGNTPFLRNARVPLRCLHINVCNMRHKHGNCVKLRGCDLVGIMEVWWCASNGLNTALEESEAWKSSSCPLCERAAEVHKAWGWLKSQLRAYR